MGLVGTLCASVVALYKHIKVPMAMNALRGPRDFICILRKRSGTFANMGRIKQDCAATG